jgi:hypothetical protein
VNTAGAYRYIVVILLTAASHLSAQSDKQDFLVNDDGCPCEQNHPRVAVDGAGGFVIAWADMRFGGSDIFLQRYGRDGNPVDINVQINDDTTGAYQSEPALAVDLSGLHTLVWSDYRNSNYPFDPDLFIQCFDSAVSPDGVNRNITTELPDSLKEAPDIALSAFGNGVVVWADFRNRNWDIYGQRIGSDGNLTGSNFIINDGPDAAQQHAPRVSVAPEGWFVVTWYDNRWGNDDVFVQRFDSDGNKIGANILVNSDGGDVRQAFPDVAADGAGHFTVVWVDWRNGSYPANSDIYARKYDTTMTPVNSEVQINQDGTTRAQREPTIAADRMGNVAIVWSDSASSSWDITGQMMDVEGVVREANFRANTDGDSAQLQADVALDGRYRYITWMDKRNGNWDIYASISKYNDPTLVPAPAALQFEMEVGGTLPDPQPLVIEHAGYNPLDFTIVSSSDWCGVAPTSGTTPDTVWVSILNSDQAYGTYLGSLRLIDNDNNNSSVVVSVRLDVTAPILSLSTDTIRLELYPGFVDNIGESVTVANDGSGSFDWIASSQVAWLSISPMSGTPPTIVTITADAAGLATGEYSESVIFNADGAIGSPDTISIILEVIDNRPFLNVSPDSIHVRTDDPSSISEPLTIQNDGRGELDWSIRIDDSWLTASLLNGTGNGAVDFTVDASTLTPGEHVTLIEITDSSAINQMRKVPFVLDLLEPVFSDTIRVGSAYAEVGGSVSFPIGITLVNNAVRIIVPLSIGSALGSVDSVLFDSTIESQATIRYFADDSSGVVVLLVEASSLSEPITEGEYTLADIYLSVGSQQGLFTIDTTRHDTLTLGVETDQGRVVVPVVFAGEIEIDAQTDVPVIQPDTGPAVYLLSQNFPNPFNNSTTIEFELPVAAEVSLELFNILGQKVATLARGWFAAGHYTTQWNGTSDDGRETASGIYFYRLEIGAESEVRKLAFLK